MELKKKIFKIHSELTSVEWANLPWKAERRCDCHQEAEDQKVKADKRTGFFFFSFRAWIFNQLKFKRTASVQMEISGRSGGDFKCDMNITNQNACMGA